MASGQADEDSDSVDVECEDNNKEDGEEMMKTSSARRETGGVSGENKENQGPVMLDAAKKGHQKNKDMKSVHSS